MKPSRTKKTTSKVASLASKNKKLTASVSDSTVKASRSTAKASDSTTKASGSTAKTKRSTVKVEQTSNKTGSSTGKVGSSTGKVVSSADKVKKPKPKAKTSGSTAKTGGSTAKASDSTAKVKRSTVKVEQPSTKTGSSTGKVVSSTSKGGSSTVAVKKQVSKSSTVAVKKQASKSRQQSRIKNPTGKVAKNSVVPYASGEEGGVPVLTIKNAREHNLKNISLQIPRNAFSVITGVSGSGKSSLAFDTILKEGQRRYIASLSSYARQFMQSSEKADVDTIEGLSPTISIDQKSGGMNPRSTVGTITEIYDFLRLLYSRLGIPHCPNGHGPISSMAGGTTEVVRRTLMQAWADETVLIMAPIVLDRKGEYRKEQEAMMKDGFLRMLINGKLHRLETIVPLLRYEKHRLEVVIDRVALTETHTARISEAIAKASELAEGRISVLRYSELVREEKPARVTYREDDQYKLFNLKNTCTVCGAGVPELEPRLFSFNSIPHACQTCRGLGETSAFDAELFVANAEKAIFDGALYVINDRGNVLYANYGSDRIETLYEHYKLDIHTPWKDLPEKFRHRLIHGVVPPKHAYSRDKIDFSLMDPLNWVYDKYKISGMNKYRHIERCTECAGSGLGVVARHISFDGKPISAFNEQTIASLSVYFENLWEEGIAGVHEDIWKPILREINERLALLNNIGLEYLTLHRKANTLSGGEAQRIRLASQIGSGLEGCLYILDEPSIGLHPSDNHKLIETLRRLRDKRNSLIVVEHDEETMLAADYLLEIGPSAGESGGEITFSGNRHNLLEYMKSRPQRIKSQTRLEKDGRSKATPALLEHEANENLSAKKTKASGGGNLVSQGTRMPTSITLEYLLGGKIAVPPEHRKVSPEMHSAWLEFIGITKFNLKDLTLRLPLGGLTVITGVSGSGKSTLLSVMTNALKSSLLHYKPLWRKAARAERLAEERKPKRTKQSLGFDSASSMGARAKEAIDGEEVVSSGNGDSGAGEGAVDVHGSGRAFVKKISGLGQIDNFLFIDQKPIGRTPRSNPATYTKAWDGIRDLFAEQKLSRIRGYTKSHFSFNVEGGRCAQCGGSGLIELDMQMFSAVEVVCEVCEGKRFNRGVLEITCNGKNIYEVLEMSLDEAYAFFKPFKKIERILSVLTEVGLGYMRLGQFSTTLSGGEAQRIKLASEIARNPQGKTVYFLDEPTTGLHFADVEKLMAALYRLSDLGHTVVVIEHNMEVIQGADYICELGPEGGEGGGKLLLAGSLDELRDSPTATGHAYEAYLDRQKQKVDGFFLKKNNLAKLFSSPGFAKQLQNQVATSGDLAKVKTDALVKGKRPRPAKGKSNLAGGEHEILIEGLRTNNLKSISLRIPKYQVTVCTGVSGSGKSSLALGSIFIEGQRKYLESLSTYARRFLGRMSRVQAERMENLSPTICIDRKKTSRSPRSIIATQTEIYDYLRVLYANIGHPHCVQCDKRLSAHTPAQAVRDIEATLEGERVIFLAPLWLAGFPFSLFIETKEKISAYLDLLLDKGYRRLLIGEELFRIDVDIDGETSSRAREKLVAKLKRASRIELVLDRMTINSDLSARILEAVERSYAISGGLLALKYEDTGHTSNTSHASTSNPSPLRALVSQAKNALGRQTYLSVDKRSDSSLGKVSDATLVSGSTGVSNSPTASDMNIANGRIYYTASFSCMEHYEILRERPTARNFSFNTHLGACSKCAGIGESLSYSIAQLIDDAEGTLLPVKNKKSAFVAPIAEWMRGNDENARQLRETMLAYFPSIFPSSSSSMSSMATTHPSWETLTMTMDDAGSDKGRSNDSNNANNNGSGSSNNNSRKARKVGETSGATNTRKTGDGQVVTNANAHTDTYKEILDTFLYGRGAWQGFYRFLEGVATTRAQALRSLKEALRPTFEMTTCTACGGGRLAPELLRVRIHNASIFDITRKTVAESLVWFKKLSSAISRREGTVVREVRAELIFRLQQMVDLGLGYLSLDRKVMTVSGGENERIRLSTQMGSRLSDVIYILDEPSVGLHEYENHLLQKVIARLKSLGNTIIIVEHSAGIIEQADYIVDIGPGAGEGGGKIAYAGPNDKYHPGFKQCSFYPYLYTQEQGLRTLTYERRRDENHPMRGCFVKEAKKKSSWRMQESDHLSLSNIRRHNLKNISLSIPLRTLTAISGVSGSGKSSLMEWLEERLNATPAGGGSSSHQPRKPRGWARRNKNAKWNNAHHEGAGDGGFLSGNLSGDLTFVRGNLTGDLGKASSKKVKENSSKESLWHGRCTIVDQSPITTNKRLIVANAIDVLTHIREAFYTTRLSRQRGYTPGHFSFNSVKGACPRCGGLGEEEIEMHFLSDIAITCEDCRGKRYRPEILDVYYNGKNIHEILELTVQEAMEFFYGIRKIEKKLRQLTDVGLGYLRCGFSTAKLSSGERQRLKIARELAFEEGVDTLYILDEPTTGLHFKDIQKLMTSLDNLICRGGTVVVVEHNIEFLRSVDYLIDLGPEGGRAGGQVVAAGTVAEVRSSRKGVTSRYL